MRAAPCTLYFVLVGTALGFSITDPFKAVGRGVAAVAKTGYKVGSDTRVQRAAVAAAQAYAPKKYAQVTKYADQARGIVRGPQPQAPGMPQQPQPQAPGMPQQPQQQMAPMPEEMMAEEPMPRSAGPVQKGNFTTLALIGGAAVLLIVLLKK